MAVTKTPQKLIKTLKQQVKRLKLHEEHTRSQLKIALKKVDSLEKTYKIELARKMRNIKGKAAQNQPATYAKIAAAIQHQLLKGIEEKANLLKVTISKLEKRQLPKLTKNMRKKQVKTSIRKHRAKKRNPTKCTW